MPQVSAALVRSAPSKTIASANIRRDAALSFSRPAAARSSMAVKSLRVTAIAAIVLAPHHTKSSSIQTFSDSGTPTSHPFSPLVLLIVRRLLLHLLRLGAASHTRIKGRRIASREALVGTYRGFIFLRLDPLALFFDVLLRFFRHGELRIRLSLATTTAGTANGSTDEEQRKRRLFRRHLV